MPSLNSYKKILGSHINGEVRKINSDEIIDFTWNEDIESKIGYFYDYYLDDEPLKYININPIESKTKIPIDIKFIVNSHNSDSKDQVSYKIQFRPSFIFNKNENLIFYKERFINKYNSEWPIGSYVDIPDEKGNYRKWLVTSEADWLDNQFPTWYVLPCDHVFQWIFENKIYQVCGVSRSQSSYNSGIWSSRGGAVQTTIPENQRICLLPMNSISSTIFYDQRIVISAPIKIPITWQVSKVDNTNPKGINTITFSQSRWNEHSDVYQYEHQDGKNDFSNKYDISRKVIGMYADYYNSNIEPTEIETETKSYYGEISYNAYPQIKVGGSYKKFIIKFIKDNKEISLPNGNWKFTINNVDKSGLVNVIQDENVLKVKFIGDDSYIGSVMNISYITTDNIETSVDVEIVGL